MYNNNGSTITLNKNITDSSSDTFNNDIFYFNNEGNEKISNNP